MAGTPYLVDRGIVLRETETKETDKILTLLTWDQGKISVIARGARRKNCKYAAASQPLAYSEWTLYQRRDWHYASDASTLELFQALQRDLKALSLGCYLAELTEATAPEDVPAPELLRHLLNGLYALSTLHKPPELVKPAFELRLMCLAGYEPLAEACGICGRETPESPVLDIMQGVLRCRACGSGVGKQLCEDSLAALRHIVYGNPKKLYSFRLGEEPLKRLSSTSEAFLHTQLDRSFSTLDFYKRIP
ncbi:DNA repair protein RecO [Oscillospiraceae bacterium 38-13]